MARMSTRLRAKSAAGDSPGLLEALLEGTGDAMFVKDAGGRFLLANEATAQMFGVERSALLGRNTAELCPPEVARAVSASDHAVMLGGMPVILEEEMPTPAGTRTFLVSKSPYRDAAGNVIGVIGIAKDITERKHADAMLQRLLTAVEQSPAAVVITDVAGEIEYVNRKFSEITGYAPEHVIGRNPRFLKSGFTPQSCYQELWDTILAGTVWRGEIQNRRKSHELYWTQATISPVKNADGVVTHFVAIQEDITEQKRAVEALGESEARYRAITDATFDGILLSRNGVILDANRGIAEIFGYDVTEIVGQTMDRFAAPESREQVQRLFGSTLEGVFEVVGLRKDGGRIRLECIVRNTKHEGQPTRLTALRDVSQRRLLEEQLRQSQKMEAVGRLAGGVAHDFNNLLTVISSYSQLVMEDMGAADPRRADLVEVRKAATGAATLTRQLLAFSRQQVLEPKVIDLNEVVAGAGQMLKRLIGEDIDLVTALSPDLGAVKVDPGQVEQVIMNLAVNARDAMPDGGKLTIETATVTLGQDYADAHRVVPPGSYVLLSVSDSGSGMDEAVKARLFEPFFTTKEQGKGTGLGLATVYGIVKQSGGFIWVYSEVGHGTTFKIYLPLVDEAVSGEPTSPPPASLHGTETILVAEDAVAVRSVAREVLRRHGYHVLAAAEGREALMAADRHPGPIHLLITDVIMPEMSGRQVADRLKERRPTIKVLFVSGYTDDAIVRHGILEPGISFLQKPFSPESLARKVREVLDAPSLPR
jgi:PAS domain S-box-containing protein